MEIDQTVSENPSAENRQAKRYPEHLGVSYSRFISDTSTPLFASDTLTLDISRTGARVLLPHEISEDILIQLHIHIPELRRPVLMLGRVKWRHRKGPPHVAGIQFLAEMPRHIENVIAQREDERRRVRVRVGPESEAG